MHFLRHRFKTRKEEEVRKKVKDKLGAYVANTQLDDVMKMKKPG